MEWSNIDDELQARLDLEISNITKYFWSPNRSLPPLLVTMGAFLLIKENMKPTIDKMKVMLKDYITRIGVNSGVKVASYEALQLLNDASGDDVKAAISSLILETLGGEIFPQWNAGEGKGLIEAMETISQFKQ